MAVRALAEGNALRATARIVQVDKDTVCAWLDRVARHCRMVMLSLWHHLHVREYQLDELWSFVHTKEAHLPGAKMYCATYGDKPRHDILATSGNFSRLDLPGANPRLAAPGFPSRICPCITSCSVF